MGFALSDMTLTSSAFDDGGPIPTRHTGEGEDVSPAMSWSKVPDGTRSFALICHDPDAPLLSPGTYGFVHWVLYGIPGSATKLPEGVADYVQGVNNFGNAGYGGPMPPAGHGTHHRQDRTERDRRESPGGHVLEVVRARRHRPAAKTGRSRVTFRFGEGFSTFSTLIV
jgi:Raf kinase inhibitor-like YbhB/YbcL family protein